MAALPETLPSAAVGSVTWHRARCLPISDVFLPADSKALPHAPSLITQCPLFIRDVTLEPPSTQKLSWPFPCHGPRWGPRLCVVTALS